MDVDGWIVQTLWRYSDTLHELRYEQQNLCAYVHIKYVRMYAYMEQHVHEVATLGELPEREEISTFVWNRA